MQEFDRLIRFYDPTSPRAREKASAMRQVLRRIRALLQPGRQSRHAEVRSAEVARALAIPQDEAFLSSFFDSAEAALATRNREIRPKILYRAPA